jgi:hypothetical protein
MAMATLSKTKATMMLRSGASEAFVIDIAYGDTVKSAVWTITDIDGKVVTLPKFTGDKSYTGVRAEFDTDGLYVRAGDSPVYVQLKIKCDLTVKTKKGATSKQVLSASVDFKDSWGGMAKAWYPYPDNYEMDWTADKKGKRAVALLHELIALLPVEFRQTAGPIPIIRTSNPKSLRGDEFRGAHLPFLFDTIQISNKLVAQLKDVPELTKEDVEFIVVVTHEIAHAATYRHCLWGTHQAMANIRKFLRKPVLPAVTWWPTALATIPTAVIAIAQQVIAPRDIVSDFSEVAGWELSSFWARVVRTAQVPTAIVDFGQWLWRIPSEGLNQNYPIRPNVVVGSQEFGGWFGLQARGLSARAAYTEALTEYNAADKAYQAATPAEKKAAKARLDKAAAAYTAAQSALQAQGAATGFVSDYATSDALEDMAETLAFYLFDKTQLKMLAEYYGDSANKTLKAKRKFFVSNKFLPSAAFKPVILGSYWQGWDTKLHLDKRVVEL